MPEPTPVTEQPVVEQEVTPAGAGGEEAPPAAKPAGDKPDPWEGLPDTHSWVKKSHEDATREAASYRVQLREAQEKLKGAKTAEEFTEITAELERKVTVLDVARKFKVADDDLEFLTGKTPEDLERQAEKLAKRAAATAPPAAEPAPIVVTKVPLSGGLQPGDGVKPRTGRELWAEHKRRNR